MRDIREETSDPQGPSAPDDTILPEKPTRVQHKVITAHKSRANVAMGSAVTVKLSFKDH